MCHARPPADCLTFATRGPHLIVFLLSQSPPSFTNQVALAELRPSPSADETEQGDGEDNYDAFIDFKERFNCTMFKMMTGRDDAGL